MQEMYSVNKGCSFAVLLYGGTLYIKLEYKMLQ